MSAADGSRTAAHGTPLAVDVSRDRRDRVLLVLVLAGPLIWSLHFLLVYGVAEAGCTGGGPGLTPFDPPVPTVVTLVATVVAALACLAAAWWAHARWRARRPIPQPADPQPADPQPADPQAADPGTATADADGTLALAGLMLSLLSFVAVVFDGVPALFLGC